MLHPAIEVIDSEIEGKGLKTTEFIPKGTVVWQLDEDERRITKGELLKLPEEKAKLAYQAGEDKYIILEDKSEVLNHSCDPNLWWDGDETLVAKRDIQPGEEITYDYSSSDVDPETFPGFECNCKAANCRGFVSYKDSLDSTFQKKYQGHLPSWVVGHIQKLKSSRMK